VKSKICYVNNTDWSLFNFRLPVLKALRDRGYHTGAIAMKGDFWERLTDIDDLIAIRNYRRRIDVFADLALIYELYSIFRKYRPDLVHFFTVKPVVYGSIAAKLAGIPLVVNTITGLGATFCRSDGPTLLLKNLILVPLYKLVCRLSDFVFFQNNTDRSLFIDQGIVSEAKTALVPGSGVDTCSFCSTTISSDNLKELRQELGIARDNCVITMVSRMILDKGVHEYVAAAEVIKARSPKAVFLLVGPTDPRNPTAIPYSQLKSWHDRGIVVYCGRRDDVQAILALSDMVVLPSYYAEGIPKVLLEAGAMAKPAVTTTTPGCADVIQDFRTGLLVEPRNVPQLADAIVLLMENATLRTELGRAARESVCSHFDLKQVVDITVGKYQELLSLKKGKPYGNSAETS
jgi:N,N'-diacetylbacillosaminyl-diphospho-undecaprenol alpha-1,3-N-acetylgalactosaminyltransferase